MEPVILRGSEMDLEWTGQELAPVRMTREQAFAAAFLDASDKEVFPDIQDSEVQYSAYGRLLAVENPEVWS